MVEPYGSDRMSGLAFQQLLLGSAAQLQFAVQTKASTTADVRHHVANVARVPHGLQRSSKAWPGWRKLLVNTASEQLL